MRGVLYGFVKTRILLAMVVYLDEPVSARGFELIPNDSPLTELVPPGSSERDRLECVLKLLLIGLEKDAVQLF